MHLRCARGGRSGRPPGRVLGIVRSFSSRHTPHGTGNSSGSANSWPPTSTQAEALVPAPFYDDGVLYVAWFVYDKALATNRQDAHLTAFDAATGRLLWQREVAHGPVNAPIGCRIDGDLYLFVAARKGLLQAYRVSRGGRGRRLVVPDAA